MNKELREIAAAYYESARTGTRCALATLVRVEGSSFRRAGARMLVSENGEMLAGCVSAGCLEADVCEWAIRVMVSGAPRLLSYSALDDGADESISLGVAPGCSGTIEILVEPLAAQRAEPIELPLVALNRGESAILATIYRCESDPNLVGARLMVGRAGDILGGRLPDDIAQTIAHAARKSLRARPARVASVPTSGGEAEVMLEALTLSPQILICGAGPGAIPLARMAEFLGWRIVVSDHRPVYLTPSRFPSVSDIVLARPEELTDRVVIDSRSACVIMTHIDTHDRALLAVLSNTSAFYVGVLGSRTRIGSLIDGLRNTGVDPAERLGPRLHAPVGLDLGGTDPDAIALAIVAEIQAVLAGRSGGPLSKLGKNGFGRARE
jgi:xanthine/CO dehydrogenase XdhC/CoxF family maturation factor